MKEREWGVRLRVAKGNFSHASSLVQLVDFGMREVDSREKSGEREGEGLEWGVDNERAIPPRRGDVEMTRWSREGRHI